MDFFSVNLSFYVFRPMLFWIGLLHAYAKFCVYKSKHDVILKKQGKRKIKYKMTNEIQNR